MRQFILPLLFLLSACAPDNRQDLDLSDYATAKPVDGIGHFVYGLGVPQVIAPGEVFELQMEWRTIGGSSPNVEYAMDVVLDGPDRHVFTVPPSGNIVGELHISNWFNHRFTAPEGLAAGAYTLGVRLRNMNEDGEVVPMGYVAEREMGDGFYELAEVTVGS